MLFSMSPRLLQRVIYRSGSASLIRQSAPPSELLSEPNCVLPEGERCNEISPESLLSALVLVHAIFGPRLEDSDKLIPGAWLEQAS
jgi:hypothetical protein